jgi:mono/diheme cytochrome c family protein
MCRLVRRAPLGQPAGVRRALACSLVAATSVVSVFAVFAAFAGGTLARGAPAPEPGAAGKSVLREPQASPAWPLYDRFCLPCHGAAGDGKGPAAPWLWPSPRDFVRGQLKWRSTPVGSPPTSADVRAAIAYGITASGMPGFADVLDEAQLDQLAELVLTFARPAMARAPAAKAAREISLGAPPAADPRRGEQQWKSLGCPVCHGERGRGDGPAAATLRDAFDRPASPHDLAAEGARRPRPPLPIGPEADRSAERHALAMSIATGLWGTPMPGFARPADRTGRTGGTGAPSNVGDLWALADFLLELRQLHAAAAAKQPAPSPPRLGALAPQAIAADELARLGAGIWPGTSEPASVLFGGDIAPQGPPPARLAPAQASLSARQCARCHATQYAAWSGSIHAAAASPGLLAQLVRTGKGELPPDEVAGCLRCHAPLAEQAEQRPPPSLGVPRWLAGTAAATAPWPRNPGYSDELQQQGITCASCHVRSWQRYGPPHIASSLLPIPGYPRTELAVYERGDFCLPCHQLPARQALAGRPLLNTYKEWLDGPYFRRGVQCQHCHMPNREHAFKGIHDPETFRQGATLAGTAVRTAASPGSAAAVTVRATVTNAGAGHYLPTTPTPAVWLTLILLDQSGAPILGSEHRVRIGRHIAYVDGAWRELEDSRIAPGQSLEVAKVYPVRVAGDAGHRARRVRMTLQVQPDEYYVRFYKMRLATERNAVARAAFEAALARAEANSYTALISTVEIR